MSTSQFYQRIASFSDFHAVTNEKHFHTVPNDWHVIITDIENSTAAIEEGRYKDVNTIGSAAIVALQNTLRNQNFPFVFGGDGATLIIHESEKDKALECLGNLQNLALQNFALHLRVGVISVSTLNTQGAIIKVAKYAINEAQTVAMFRGGGITLAESKIKSDPTQYCIQSTKNSDVNLEGLSCRWDKIPSKHGTILSVLVMARCEDQSEVYDKILKHIDQQENPIHPEYMEGVGIKKAIISERLYFSSPFNPYYWLRVLEIIFTGFLFKFNINFVLKPKPYKNAMREHTDYRKFDDMLRMVIDCTEGDAKTTQNYLQQLYSSGEIFYGIFQSDSSLITCLVHGLSDGKHIHFVDGSDGGYAMAAKQLKAQMKKANV